jgi:hypothetical protein
MACCSWLHSDVPCGSKRIAFQRVWQFFGLSGGHDSLLYVEIGNDRTGRELKLYVNPR